MNESASSITARRFHRSINAPAKGPRMIWGIRATIDAVARTVADPVVIVSHQTRAN